MVLLVIGCIIAIIVLSLWWIATCKVSSQADERDNELFSKWLNEKKEEQK